jgi:hypothetical protein
MAMANTKSYRRIQTKESRETIEYPLSNRGHLSYCAFFLCLQTSEFSFRMLV